MALTNYVCYAEDAEEVAMARAAFTAAGFMLDAEREEPSDFLPLRLTFSTTATLQQLRDAVQPELHGRAIDWTLKIHADCYRVCGRMADFSCVVCPTCVCNTCRAELEGTVIATPEGQPWSCEKHCYRIWRFTDAFNPDGFGSYHHGYVNAVKVAIISKQYWVHTHMDDDGKKEHIYHVVRVENEHKGTITTRAPQDPMAVQLPPGEVLFDWARDGNLLVWLRLPKELSAYLNKPATYAAWTDAAIGFRRASPDD